LEFVKIFPTEKYPELGVLVELLIQFQTLLLCILLVLIYSNSKATVLTVQFSDRISVLRADLRFGQANHRILSSDS